MDETVLKKCKYSRGQRVRDALKDGVRKRKKKARLMGELGERLKEGSKDKVKSEKKHQTIY